MRFTINFGFWKFSDKVLTVFAHKIVELLRIYVMATLTLLLLQLMIYWMHSKSISCTRLLMKVEMCRIDFLTYHVSHQYGPILSNLLLPSIIFQRLIIKSVTSIY